MFSSNDYTSFDLVSNKFSLLYQEERSKVDDLRGTPMSVGSLEEIIDDNHAIVSTSVGSEHYVSILSFVDKDQLEPGCSVLLNHKVHAVVGVLSDDTDPMVTVMKLEKAPQETYADIGGLDQQIQEIKVRYAEFSYLCIVCYLIFDSFWTLQKHHIIVLALGSSVQSQGNLKNKEKLKTKYGFEKR